MSLIRRIKLLGQREASAPQRFRLCKSVLVAAVASLIGMSAVYGLYRYRGRVACDESYCVKPAELRLLQATTWMTPEIEEEIRQSLYQLPERLSVMDPRSAERLARCLESNPWIRKVYYVRLDRPQAGGRSQGLEASMAFRRPVAFVEVGQGAAARYCLVDRDGVRLGANAFPEPQLGDRVLITVTGAGSAPPEAGQVWADPAVLAGADVANTFRDRVVKFNLARIDVSNIDHRRDRRDAQIVIHTKRSGTRILWGGPRCRKTEIIEGCTAAQKLDCLDHLHETLGGLDGRAEEIDLVERQLRKCQPAVQRARSVRS